MKNKIYNLRGMTSSYRSMLFRSAFNVAVGMINMISSLSFIVVSKQLIDTVTGVSTHSIRSGIIIMCVLVVVRLFASVLYSYIGGRNEAHGLMALRRSFFEKLMYLQWDGTELFHSGDAVNRVEDDVRVVVDFVALKLPSFVLAGMQLLFASVLVYMMSPKLLLVLVALMVIAALLGYFLYRPVRSLTRIIRRQEGVIQSHLQESIQNRITVRVLLGVKRIMERFDTLQDKQYSDMIRRLNYNSFAQLCMRFGFFSGYTAAFIFGVKGIEGGFVTFGMMTALLQLVGQVQRPLSSLVQLFPNVIRFMASKERLEEIAACNEEKEMPEKRIKIAPEIRIEDVSFVYPGQQQRILNHFSAVFPAGKMTAITGETGVGKTTLVRLILALLEPLEGRITIGGELAGIDTRCNFMFVPQNNGLFSGTIRDNLLLVKPTATEEEMQEALQIAMADFVFNLPQGLDTPCYEYGNGISGGQARRISIACALLHGGSIVILDEATASLDQETERLLLERLKQYCAGKKTLIFISHSNLVCRMADTIVEIPNTRIPC